MTKIAVILSGCGHLDGAEIRESVITLLELDKAGAEVKIFAPNIEQRDVVNHLTGKAENEKRNVLVEAARIARGKISDLKEAKAADFDALIMPGGFGVAKNLSSVAFDGPKATVLPEVKNLILGFLKAKKPIGAICISPAALVAAVKDEAKLKVTVGSKKDGELITAMGGIHEACLAAEIAIDDEHNIATCPAYMTTEPLSEIAKGIAGVVHEVMKRAEARKKAA